MITELDKPKESTKDEFQFDYLPAYAAFLLDKKLEAFVALGLRLSREEKLPVLKYFASYSEDQLLELSRVANRELLGSLAGNNIRSYVEKTLKTWTENRMGIITRDDIVAEDITKGSYVRRKLFRILLHEYTDDRELYENILDEIDQFTTQNELLSYNTFISLQKEKLSSINSELSIREAQLLEAQQLAEMGSFYWDMENPEKSVYTPQITTIFGLSKKERLEDFLNHVHINDREHFYSCINTARNNDGQFDCEYRYIREDKEKKIWARGKVDFKGEKPVSMKGTVMDITKKYMLLQQLKELNTSLAYKNVELERINDELESFNYVASHDLQEPLRKIQTYSGRLSEFKGQLPAAAADYIEKITSSSTRMQHLIEDLLEFSQLSSPSEAFEDTDLNEVLEEAKRSISDAIEKSGAIIQSGHLPTVHVIPFQFSQLFTNILGNAIKYRKEDEKPFIQVTSENVKAIDPEKKTEREYIKIMIRDNGIGFDPEYAEKIFDLFKRLHAREKYSGTGIGLSICKKIVHNHDGFIKAESEKNKGAVFSIFLPASILVRK